jgi:hypothetical protein
VRFDDNRGSYTRVSFRQRVKSGSLAALHPKAGASSAKH